jgi:hypothetical protein
VTALNAEDFASAREDLLWLASRCEAGEHGRRAMLQLAAAELDTENPHGSARAAALLAAGYLVLPDAEANQLPVARALYRLAADHGGLSEGAEAEEDGADPLPSLAVRFDTCQPMPDMEWARRLPDPPGLTTSARIAALESELAAASDSLSILRERNGALRGRNAALQARTGELEAEIQRVAELLRNGMPGLARRDDR